MWQIHNTKQNSNKASAQNLEISLEKENITQSYSWKYGKVYLSTRQQVTQFNKGGSSWVLITTQPFFNVINTNDKYRQVKGRTIFVQSSQQNKTLQTVDHVCKMMLKLGINRQSTIYILGGGLLLDLGGFASSIYMRGVKKVVYIPTTLLAVVDATVGGKNGINWSGAKNMLGVIRHAHQIRISMHYLDTLSDRQFSNGLAQVIKMSITHDRQLFELLQKDSITLCILRQNKQLLRTLIKKSLQIKIKVVQRDQFDRGERNWLNFGHTVGHAIELSTSGQDLMHGQCVSIGYKIGQIKHKGIYERIQSILKKYNLPTKIPQNTIGSQIINLMTKDKKNKQSEIIQLTLIQQIGKRKTQTTPIPIDKLYQHFNNKLSIQLNKQIKKQIEETNQQWQINNKFPSSKSLAIRYLFLAALHYYHHRQTLLILNFLFSDDTECIRHSLIALGFLINYNLQQKVIQINGYQPKKYGTINVGNSGLTARFILPLCCHIQGQWTINCHPRMSERPNKQIFQFCRQHYDVKFNHLLQNSQNTFPVQVVSKGLIAQSLNKPITISSQKSSQFLSSIILNSYIWARNIQIKIPSDKLVSESYVHMTIQCMRQFGTIIRKNKHLNQIIISLSKTDNKQIQKIIIQKDLSSFSYPFALALIHSSKLPQLPSISKQGDVKFYQYCHQLVNNTLPSQLQFSQCTDTFMTFASILATNCNNRFNIKHQYIKINGIGNQRVKQSNRIQLTKQNLAKIGYYIEQTEDGLVFPIHSHAYMYKKFTHNQTIIFETAGDHRLAMSMAILSTYLAKQQNISKLGVKFVIDDKSAVNKTFPSFWQYITQAGINLNHKIQLPQPQVNTFPNIIPKKQKHNKIVLLGNRGCGKTSIGQLLLQHHPHNPTITNYLIDIDKQITKQIASQNNQINNIKQFVECYGWEQFRILENKMIDKFVTSSYLDHAYNSACGKQVNYIVATGGGVVDWQSSVQLLCRQNKKHINLYIQKQLKDLQIQLNQNRPYINNFQQVFKTRSNKYQKIADYIVTIPGLKQNRYHSMNQYIVSQFNRIFKSINGQSDMKQGIIYCIPRVYQDIQQRKPINWNQQQQFKIQQPDYVNNLKNDTITGIQLRIDSIIEHALSLNPQLRQSMDKLIRQCRYSIANFKYTNNQIIKPLSIILTLRTKNQLGLFPNNYNPQQSYHAWMNQLHKIPAQYIDYQYKKYIQNKNNKHIHKFPNYIYSYHGDNLPTISNLLHRRHLPLQPNNPLIKLCFNGSHHIWQQHHQKWASKSHICINLRNPITRLSASNKYKMVIAQNDTTGIIQIPNRRQLRLLASLQRLFIRF